MLLANIAKATRDHDGLVIPANTAGSPGFKGAEITRQIGATKLVIESRCANRPLGHDLQRRDNAVRAAVAQLPGPRLIGDLQV